MKITSGACSQHETDEMSICKKLNIKCNANQKSSTNKLDLTNNLKGKSYKIQI